MSRQERTAQLRICILALLSGTRMNSRDGGQTVHKRLSVFIASLNPSNQKSETVQGTFGPIRELLRAFNSCALLTLITETAISSCVNHVRATTSYLHENPVSIYRWQSFCKRNEAATTFLRGAIFRNDRSLKATACIRAGVGICITTELNMPLFNKVGREKLKLEIYSGRKCIEFSRSTGSLESKLENAINQK